MSVLSDNLKRVEERICAACERSGRNRDDVLLVAVSKTKPVEMISELYDLGIRDFGENKVQEICAKAPVLPSDINWHMIGHLQQNKVRQVVPKAVMIHSVDSLYLAEAISKYAVKNERICDILLEVNIAGEESKFGTGESSAIEMAGKISLLPNIKIKGLMTIAPFVDDPEENRVFFRKMRDLSVDIEQKKFDNVSMSVLSMGMTNDFETAIEEGATIVRIGTAIFGERFRGHV